MKDTDLMPFGKYKGQMLASIPDDYLLWMHGELTKKCSRFAEPLKEYLDDNLEAIKKNIEDQKPFWND